MPFGEEDVFQRGNDLDRPYALRAPFVARKTGRACKQNGILFKQRLRKTQERELDNLAGIERGIVPCRGTIADAGSAVVTVRKVLRVLNG